jgi:tetratricopeptide (TPR) repeat protein
MQQPKPQSREERRAQRAQRIEQAWKDHYYELVNGEITLAEILNHSDQQLMRAADEGLRLLKLGKYEPARKILAGLPLLDPYVPYFHLLLGTLHERVGEMEEAAAEYEQTIELCESMSPPGRLLPVSLLAAAKVWTRLERVGAALQAVRRVLSDEIPRCDPKVRREAQVMETYLEGLAGAGNG